MSVESASSKPASEDQELLVASDNQGVTKDKKNKKKRKNKKKQKADYEMFSKSAVSVLRTILRNNADFTNIADNKANVLLSLNAIMLTFFVPLILPNIGLVRQYRLTIPLIILVLTCVVTIYIAFLVLRPGKFGDQRVSLQEGTQLSPFFFGNFEKMKKEDYFQHFENVLSDEQKVTQFLGNDFYFLGLRLGEKMKYVRLAFNIFIAGLFLSILLSIILIIIYS